MRRRSATPGLIVELRQGESIAFSGAASLELLHKSGQHARLRVVAAEDVRIAKQEPCRAKKPVPSMA